uniref:Uncharacterized protein n=1 Tax=Cacopsylla melanoneura TaxID=428564 RepID=A0A8D8Z8A7_9HEMI
MHAQDQLAVLSAMGILLLCGNAKLAGNPLVRNTPYPQPSIFLIFPSEICQGYFNVNLGLLNGPPPSQFSHHARTESFKNQFKKKCDLTPEKAWISYATSHNPSLG